jgi:hypothetical protein
MALRSRPAKLIRGATTPSIVQSRDLTSFAALMAVMFFIAALLVAMW